MKVFISWSGSAAHEAAKALRDWLPYLIHKLDPWVSSEDIAKGETSLPTISQNLQDAGFGLICVTPDSARSPWVNFEAGAMANSLVRVAPILIGLTGQELVKSPLTQFQHAPFDDKDEMLKVVMSMLEVCPESGLTEERLRNNFEKFWPDLESTIQTIKTKLANVSPPTPSVSDKVDELLGLARQSQRRIDRLELLVGPTLQHAYMGAPNTRRFTSWLAQKPPGAPRSLKEAQGILASLLGGEASVDVGKEGLHVTFANKPSKQADRLIRDVGDASGIAIQVSYGEPSPTPAPVEEAAQE